ncbi:hypothetical protein [Clostridium formicaceticum]|nr:hypothetical protein [Clostridium formicaceticum]
MTSGRENASQIINDGQIKKLKDSHCWFCETIEDAFEIMRNTIMKEGTKYVGTDGLIKTYGKFVPDEWLIIKGTPKYSDPMNYFIWHNETDGNIRASAQAIRNETIKIGYKGNLGLKNIEVLELSNVK